MSGQLLPLVGVASLNYEEHITGGPSICGSTKSTTQKHRHRYTHEHKETDTHTDTQTHIETRTLKDEVKDTLVPRQWL